MIMKQFIYILTLLLSLPSYALADKFIYDGLYIGMDNNKLQSTGYTDCQTESSMGPNWISCSNPKNFFPTFQGYNVDDVEIELPDGKTISAINLITSANINPNILVKQVKGHLIEKNKLSLISINNHIDSLMVIQGKIAILNNTR